MHSFAQTNLQWFNQMRREGYANDDLAVARNGYECAMELFTGQFRASGKTFLAHLVGTASILISWRARCNIAVAGVLHAAYMSGNFGALDLDGKRAWMSTRVGPNIERYIERYTAIGLGPARIRSLVRHGTPTDPIDADVVLICLANELEDLLDLAPLYSSDWRCKQNVRMGRLWALVAHDLGRADIVEEFERALSAVDGARLPNELRSENGRDRSFTLRPPREHITDSVF